MNYEYNKKSDTFSVDIKVNINNEEDQKLVDSIGDIVVSNLCLLDTKLRNTCLNLLHEYTKKLLENLSDYASINDVELNEEARKIVDENCSYNEFCPWKQ